MFQYNSYYIINSMNRKGIDEVCQVEAYNHLLLAKSIDSLQEIQSLPSREAARYYHHYPSIHQHHQQLENILAKRIKLLSEVFQVERPKVGGVLQHAVELFDEITDSIDTTANKYQLQKKSHKRNIQPLNKDPHRPQDQYPSIRPSQFSYHSHALSLQYINLSSSISASQPILQPFIYVDTLPDMINMIKQLVVSSEIAVDLEHSNKSYQGMTCLIQISSRHHDYVIDVFPLWNEMGRLKEVIGNNRIVKVMHGAEMDVKWLQRDFDIHVVNLFDTYKASRVLGFPKLSYAYLLSHYCHVETDKSYQTADWRVRPLTSEMLLYARTDTHYLLEIWDRMRGDLISKANLMNLQPIGVLRNIYEVSHQVTYTQVDLFSYPKLEIYQNLKYQMKDSHFQIVDALFWTINELAMKYDQCFYEVVSKKLILESIAVIKDIIYNRTSKVSKVMRIDKIISILSKSKFIAIAELIATIKIQLQAYFISSNQPQTNIHHQSTYLQPTVHHKIQQSIIQEDCQLQRIKQPSGLYQYQQQTYQEQIKHEHRRHYIPIIQFIANKYGKELIQQQPAQLVEEINQSNQPQIQTQQQQDESKVIKFKRMNPNVIYAIEDPQINEVKGRKKRKQQRYEEKLKNKRGNIFDYLEDK